MNYNETLNEYLKELNEVYEKIASSLVEDLEGWNLCDESGEQPVYINDKLGISIIIEQPHLRVKISTGKMYFLNDKQTDVVLLRLMVDVRELMGNAIFMANKRKDLALSSI